MKNRTTYQYILLVVLVILLVCLFSRKEYFTVASSNVGPQDLAQLKLQLQYGADQLAGYSDAVIQTMANDYAKAMLDYKEVPNCIDILRKVENGFSLFIRTFFQTQGGKNLSNAIRLICTDTNVKKVLKPVANTKDLLILIFKGVIVNRLYNVSNILSIYQNPLDPNIRIPSDAEILNEANRLANSLPQINSQLINAAKRFVITFLNTEIGKQILQFLNTHAATYGTFNSILNNVIPN